MPMVGWVELIVLVALLAFIGIIYLVYWEKKRKIVVGLFFLIAGSVIFLYLGTSFFASWILKGPPPIYPPNTPVLVLVSTLNASAIGVAVYGLVSAYRALRTYFKS
ncbi:hypothetical protein GWO13_09810 [Candidatus Bathyarchaeota archaeon]|nr:hypothetical protein [Candidatus Bathyarchaeota archaeon]